MTIYDFIKTHTIDEIVEEVTKDLDAKTDLQAFFGVGGRYIIYEHACKAYRCKYFSTADKMCSSQSKEQECPCLKDQKKYYKQVIKDFMNVDVEGD